MPKLILNLPAGMTADQVSVDFLTDEQIAMDEADKGSSDTAKSPEPVTDSAPTTNPETTADEIVTPSTPAE